MIRTGKLQSRIHLFARPSFLTGIARIIDVRGTLNKYNSSSSESLADCRALFSDWATVGDDLRAAIQQYESEGQNSS